MNTSFFGEMKKMKITRSISIDSEVWEELGRKAGNRSAMVNHLIQRWVETEAEEYERTKVEEMKAQKEEATTKLAVLQTELDKMKKKEEEEKKKIIRVIE